MKYLTIILLSFVMSLELLSARLLVQAHEELKPQAGAFVEALTKLGVEDVSLEDELGNNSGVIFSMDDQLPAEGFKIGIKGYGMSVRASDTAGAAYASAELIRRAKIEGGKAAWSDGLWEAAPDFSYRSFLIDMGRNPHSPKTLKHVVDMMWFYGGNYLQLHLTDDQMISWPSEAYPELYSEHAGWTMDAFRELEAYSQARGVTIVPELEVPGHSTLLRRRRPDVFGETTEYLATSPRAQKGVEALITEMLSVFKATPFMHIGADEVHGVSQEDQRDFINRLNEHVKSLGRTTVVWEGPGMGKGDNKVSEDVLHMAWEGRYLAMTAMVEAGYKVVNAAWDPFYIVDHYPRTNFTGVPLDQIYHADLRRMKNVDPRLPSFHRPQMLEDTKSVVGFAMPWWEGREFNLLPLCVKRFAAASTRAWDYDSKLSYEDYTAREEKLLPRLEQISGFELPEMPMGDPKKAAEAGNFAYGGKVEPSWGEHQPHFVPARLTNGITDQFDLFLGYPADPEPLVIDIELKEESEISRISVHEMAVRGSWEKYRVYVSKDGKTFEKIGETKQGDRGEGRVVEHRFKRRKAKVIRIETNGCENFTFHSFSRLTEVEAFAE